MDTPELMDAEVVTSGRLELKSLKAGEMWWEVNGERVEVSQANYDELAAQIVSQIYDGGLKAWVSGREITYAIENGLTGPETKEMKIRDETGLPLGYVSFVDSGDPSEGRVKVLMKKIHDPVADEGKGLMSVGMGLLAEVLKQEGVKVLVGDIEVGNEKSVKSRQNIPKILLGGMYETREVKRDLNRAVWETLLE